MLPIALFDSFDGMVYSFYKGDDFMANNYPRMLSILSAIQRFGNITHAAKHLFITQPALSRTLKNEEKKLNVLLVDRTVRPIRLTYAGEEYLHGLQNINIATKQLSDKMSEISQSKSGQLSIGLSETLGTLFLPKLIQLYNTKFPQYHLNISEMASTQAARAVIDNQLDLYIGPKPLERGHFIYRKIKTIHFNLICPRGIDLNKLSQITSSSQFQLLKPLNYIGIDPSMITGIFLNRFLKNANLRILPWIQLKNFQTILQIIEQGLGYSILPAYYQANSKYTVSIPIDSELLNNELIIAHRASKINSPEMVAFLDIMKPLFGVDPSHQPILRDDT